MATALPSRLALSIATVFFMTCKGQGQGEMAELIVPDNFAADFLGYSVSVNGTVAIVGAYGGQGNTPGKAYIFRRSASNWNLEATLLASDGMSGGSRSFGTSVSVSGGFAVIGDFENGSSQGGAYVFQFDGSSWVEVQKLQSPNPQGNGFFGASVSTDGVRAVVGTDGEDRAYVFRREPGGWLFEAELVPLPPVLGDHFGFSVSISGDRVIIGADQHDFWGPSSGSAFVFRREGTAWTQEAQLNPDDGATADRFGGSVAISGTRAVIGAWRDDDAGIESGSAYVFRRDGTVWTQEAKLVAKDGAADDFFGLSVSISSDSVLVGARLDDDLGIDSGSAYLFRRMGSVWVQDVKLVASNGSTGDEFGSSVSLSGGQGIVGAPKELPPVDSGAAYVFDCGCPWDMDADGSVAVPDLLALLAAWGTNPGGPPDFDGDGVVAVPDLLTLLANWGPCP